MKKKKVLHVIKVMDRAGAETMIMNILRNIDKTKFQFDFLCLSEKEGDYDKEIIEFGGKILIEHINFDINKGDKIAIIGKNGCGKTSLLKV